MTSRRLSLLMRLAAICCAPLAAGAYAQTSGSWYADAGSGFAHLQARCGNTVSCERDGLGWLLGAGYMLPATLAGGTPAVEFRWLSTDTRRLASSSLMADLQVQAPMLGLAWWRSMSPAWTIGIGGGVAYMNVEAKLSPVGGQAVTLTDDRWQGYGMAAVQMAVSPDVRLQLSFLASRARFDKAGIDLHEGWLRQVTLGASFAF